MDGQTGTNTSAPGVSAAPDTGIDRNHRREDLTVNLNAQTAPAPPANPAVAP